MEIKLQIDKVRREADGELEESDNLMAVFDELDLGDATGESDIISI